MPTFEELKNAHGNALSRGNTQDAAILEKAMSEIQPPEPTQPSIDELKSAMQNALNRGNSEDALILNRAIQSMTPEALMMESIPKRPEPELSVIDQAVDAGRYIGNIGKGIGEALLDIPGHIVSTVDAVTRPVSDFLDEKLGTGQLIWEEGDVLPSYYSKKEVEAIPKEQYVRKFDQIANGLKNADLAFQEEEVANWESVKKEFRDGGALSGSAYAEAIEAGLAGTALSTPDMLAAFFALPAYVTSLVGRVGEQRAANKGKDRMTAVDAIEAVPAAIGVAILDRIGVKSVTSDIAEKVGKEALESGVKETAKEVAKGGSKFAVTEAMQTGLVEYVGERYGTNAAMSFGESLDKVAEGLVLGGIGGSTIAAGTAGVKAAPAIKEKATNATKDLAERAPKTFKGAAEAASGKIQQAKDSLLGDEAPADKSLSAAELSRAEVAQRKADELPVPMKLTLGRATQRDDDLGFEHNIARREEGRALRERELDYNQQIAQNIDAFIEGEGVKETDKILIAENLDKSLKRQLKKAKTKERIAYKKAEKAGEMEAPVNMDGLANFLNENRAARGTAKILNAAQQELMVLESADGFFNRGNLNIKPMTLREVETLRSFLNSAVDGSNAPDVRMLTKMKQVIDEATEGKGGDLYKAARRLTVERKKKFENIGLIDRLMNTKRGSDDRKTALEDMADAAITSPRAKVADLKVLRDILEDGGRQSKQVWRDLKARALTRIIDNATESGMKDERGNPLISSAKFKKGIRNLDESGKLEFLYGKKKAELIRLLADVISDVLDTRSGIVNRSGTAPTLHMLADMVGMVGTGIPAPVATLLKVAKDKTQERALKRRIDKALAGVKTK